MATVFHLQLARRRRWELIGAIFLTIVFAVYLVVAYQGAHRLYPSLFIGACALYRWVQWSRLARTPDATIELDDSGIRFSPPDYWQVDRIDWKEVTDLKTESKAIWLLYRKDGAERTRDIQRTDLTVEDCTGIVDAIQQRLSARRQA